MHDALSRNLDAFLTSNVILSRPRPVEQPGIRVVGAASGDHVGMSAASVPEVLSREDNSSPRLERYVERTQNALDLFALLTLWIVLVPWSELNRGGASIPAVAARVFISSVYGVDMAVRCSMAPQGLRYARQHPIGLLAVVLPPIRVAFSLRLVQSLFRRGALGRFLLAAGGLLLNGTVIVFYVERDARGANITSLGESVWWSVVTVTTVGYGDLYPVTMYGRVVATSVMLIGLLSLAVITAQISSSYNEQARLRRVAAAGESEPDTVEADLSAVDLRDLRDRINVLLGEPSARAHGPARDADAAPDAGGAPPS